MIKEFAVLFLSALLAVEHITRDGRLPKAGSTEYRAQAEHKQSTEHRDGVAGVLMTER